MNFVLLVLLILQRGRKVRVRMFFYPFSLYCITCMNGPCFLIQKAILFCSNQLYVYTFSDKEYNTVP